MVIEGKNLSIMLILGKIVFGEFRDSVAKAVYLIIFSKISH